MDLQPAEDCLQRPKVRFESQPASSTLECAAFKLISQKCKGEDFNVTDVDITCSTRISEKNGGANAYDM